MNKWMGKLLRMMGLDLMGDVKAPELGRAISAEELQRKGHGFIAIADREKQKTEIWLCTRALLIDREAVGTEKHALRWEDYGLTWQAYEIREFAGWGKDE